MGFDPRKFIGETTDESEKKAGFDPYSFVGESAPEPVPNVVRRMELTPEQKAKVERTTKAGLIEPEKPSILSELKDTVLPKRSVNTATKNEGARGTFAQQAEWARYGVPAEAQVHQFGSPDDIRAAERVKATALAGMAGGAAAAPIAGALTAAGAPLAGATASALASGAAARGANAAIDRKPILPAVFDKEAAKEDFVTGVGPLALLRLPGGVKNTVAAAGDSARQRVRVGPANEILAKATPVKRENALAKLGGEEGVADAFNSSEAMQRAARRGPAAVVKEAKTQKTPIGKEIGALVSNADTANPAGMPVSRAKSALMKLRAEAKEALDAPRVATIDREIRAIEKLADGDTIKASQLHKLSRRFGKGGFAGSFSDPTEAKQLGRDMKTAVQGELHAYVDEVTPGARGKLEALNKQFSALAEVGTLAKSAASKAKGGKLRDGLTGLGAAAGLASSFVTESPMLAAGTLLGAAGVKYGPGAKKLADRALAQLTRGVKAGDPGAVTQLADEAIRAGVSPATVNAVIKSGR